MVNNQEFIFKDLSSEEKEKRGILGRLYGPCASISIPTRNGRLYSESLWNKVFEDNDNSIVTELFKNGGIPMELDHPADRLETCSDRIAAMLPEPPKRDKDGHLVCSVDLIDTPCGKIAYQLAKYGFNLGISSRGNGETITDEDGNESVDPDTYDFQTFDLVLIPAVKDARLKLMTESLNGKTLKQALCESLEKASTDDRKIMQETLDNLNIDYSDSKESDNINESAAKDNGADLVKTLQESLLAKETAEAKITELQEKLSVCYAKEASMEEDLNKYKTAIRNLSEKASNVKILQSKLEALTEELSKKDNLIQEHLDKVKLYEEKEKASLDKTNTLNENLSNKETQLKRATQRVGILSEELDAAKARFESEKQTLVESYESLKKDYTIKQSEYTTKLSNANKLVEQYRGTAKKAVDKYIDSKSVTLGIDPRDVKNKLPENYSFSDIDNLCEELSNYSLQINGLPFNLKSVRKVSITESKKLPGTKSNINDGDEIDDSLLRVARNISQNK